ncbi:MAG: amidohydrolase family protein [Candidatus Binatia bacterium]
MRIDVHAHYYPDQYISLVSRFRGETNYRIRAPGAAVTLEQRVDLLDKAGIRVQILSVGAQQPYFDNFNDAVSAARLGNNLYAEVCAQHGGHFAAFAALPLPHVEAALGELERALDRLGMVGVNLGCTVAGRPLDDAEFEPLFAELDRRGAVLFLHPVGCGCGTLLEGFDLDFPLGAPFEDSVAALRLVLAGIVSRHPKIRIIVPHLGGTLPFLIERLDGSLAGRSQYKPSEYLKRLCYDTVNGSPAALRCSRDAFGADRLLLGTDFPHLAGPRFEQCVSYIQQSNLPEEEKSAILDNNAQLLLGLAQR